MRPIYHVPSLNPPSTTLRTYVFAYALLQKTNRHVPKGIVAHFEWNVKL